MTVEKSEIVLISSFFFGGALTCLLSSAGNVLRFKKNIARFRDVDFKVKLGSILEKDVRDYCVENRFTFLEEKIAAMISHTQTPRRKS